VSFLVAFFIATSNGATTDPEKVKAIKEFPEPKSVFKVRSFLGVANYYRCFIKDFAAIARPISKTISRQFVGIDRRTFRFVSLSPTERHSKSCAIYLRQKTSCSATLNIRSYLI